MVVSVLLMVGPSLYTEQEGGKQARTGDGSKGKAGVITIGKLPVKVTDQ